MTDQTITTRCPVCDVHRFDVAITRDGDLVELRDGVPEYCPACRILFSVEDMNQIRDEVLTLAAVPDEEEERYASPPPFAWMRTRSAA